MTPAALAARIHHQMLREVDVEFGDGQRRFFQHEVDTYGVRTAKITEIVRGVYREIKNWSREDRHQLMTLLWETGKLESGTVVCHVCRRFARSLGEDDFWVFSYWMDHYVFNWAHCDGVGTFLLAACIGNVPRLIDEVVPWTASSNRWRRRAAAVSLVHEAKAGRHTRAILEVARLLLPDRDDMVQKGVGWLLKEAYPARPQETFDFLMAHRTEATRLTLRYAAEKMPPTVRASLLQSRATDGPR